MSALSSQFSSPLVRRFSASSCRIHTLCFLCLAVTLLILISTFCGLLSEILCYIVYAICFICISYKFYHFIYGYMNNMQYTSIDLTNLIDSIDVAIVKLLRKNINLLFIASSDLCCYGILHNLMHNPASRSTINVYFQLYNPMRELIPSYTIIIALYKEAEVAEQCAQSILNIEYPKNKLQIIFMLEEDDIETCTKLHSLDLPACCSIMIAPHGTPKTKARACNIALSHAQNDIISLYDAEDIPDALQLIKVSALMTAYPDIACVQCMLGYYNAERNTLTYMFALEYEGLFNHILVSMSKFGTYIPLGGSSNHIRRDVILALGGWDPFNVTEDAELGACLAINNYKTRVLNSYTLEEAPGSIVAWLKQRSRWIKGHFYTYICYLRSFAFRKSAITCTAMHCFIGLPSIILLMTIIFAIISITNFALYKTINSNLKVYISFYILLTYLVSYLIQGYYSGKNIRTMRKPQFTKYIWLIYPMYFILHNIAGVIALYDIVMKPFLWRKTQHNAIAKVQ